jgi:flagellar biogenesis protein FliO
MRLRLALRSLFVRLRAAAGERAAPAGLRRESSLRLTPHHSIHLVAIGDRRWLLACHSSGVQPIAELPAATAPRQPLAMGASLR